MTEQDRSMITLVATRAKHAGTGTIKVCKQCSMRSHYAVKHGSSTRVNLLRPKPAPPTYIERLCEPHGEDGKVRGLRFVQAEKFEQLWQNAIQGNSKSEPTCTGILELDKDSERQVGLCWQERIKCNTCGYLSEREKLYNEVDRGRRGRKVAAPNLAVQVGLTHMPMANTGLQTLLHSLDVPSSSTSTL